MAAQVIPIPNPRLPYQLDHTLPNNISLFGANCTQGLCLTGDEWTDTSKDILYIAFPILIGLGVILNFLSMIVLARCVRISNDSYLVGLSLSNFLLLVCAGLLHIQDYIGHCDLYQHAYGYLKSIHSWQWYSALWIIMVMTLERSMNLTETRERSSLCTSLQAGVVVLMVLIVCLVSALPEFFEYEVIEIFDYVKNRTTSMYRPSEASAAPEYKIMYFWYRMSISIFLPYPFLFIMLILLLQRMKRSRNKRKCLSVKQQGGSGQILSRKLSEEMHITRLCIVLILLYYILTGPYGVWHLVSVIHPQWFRDEAALSTGLYHIFEFIFYAYFSILFFLLCSYNDKFRHSLAHMCCCCCIVSRKKSKMRKRKKKR